MPEHADKATALWVLKHLRAAGHQALFAGGCVRDMLMGRRPADYDIATSATPQQVRKLFRHVLLVGAQFGVAVVVRRKRHVEVATFRTDVSYTDGRRPDAVRFVTAREDAMRRDFTINGMFYDPVVGEVIDYVGGRADLERKIVRTIGRPDERFAEDYLRLLRAVRFSARLGFELSAETAAGVRRHAARIASVSGERIYDELGKMLAHPAAGRALELARELGLAEEILPELFRQPGLWERAVGHVRAVRAGRDAGLAFASLLCELPPDEMKAVVRRWGGPNWLRDVLSFCHEHLADWRVAVEMPLCDFKRLLANEHFPRLRRLWRVEEQRETGANREARRIARRASAIPADRVAPPPLVAGADLLAMGLPAGPAVGRILHTLYDEQLNEQLHDRDHALARARELAQK